MDTFGLYSISRNPAFAGFDLMCGGTALALLNLVMTVCVVATIIVLHLQILE